MLNILGILTLLLLCRYPAVLTGITFHAYAMSKLFHFLSFVIYIIICLICHLEPHVQRCCQGQSCSPLWCNCSSDGYAVGEAEQTPVHQRFCPAVDLILLLSTNHLQTPPALPCTPRSSWIITDPLPRAHLGRETA